MTSSLTTEDQIFQEMEEARSFYASMEVANMSLVGVTDSSGSYSSTFNTRSNPVQDNASQPAVSKTVFLSFLSAQTLSLCCNFPSVIQLKCLCACLTPTVCHHHDHNMWANNLSFRFNAQHVLALLLSSCFSWSLCFCLHHKVNPSLPVCWASLHISCV